MSELISGKEALIALANGEDVEWRHPERDWFKAPQCSMRTQDFFSGVYQFRLKPRTITINGIELAPCYAVGIDHIKNEVSIQFHNNEDAVKLNSLLLNIYGFRNA